MRPSPNDYKDLNPSDRNVRVVDGSLILKNIQKSHEGYYLCKASNGIGGISAVAKMSGKIFFSYMILLTGSNNQFRNCESEFFKPNSKLFRYLGAFLNYVDQKTRYLGTVLEMSTAYINFTIRNSKKCSFAIDAYIHSVSYVYAVLPFCDVKCLCSGGRE